MLPFFMSFLFITIFWASLFTLFILVKYLVLLFLVFANIWTSFISSFVFSLQYTSSNLLIFTLLIIVFTSLIVPWNINRASMLSVCYHSLSFFFLTITFCTSLFDHIVFLSTIFHFLLSRASSAIIFIVSVISFKTLFMSPYINQLTLSFTSFAITAICSLFNVQHFIFESSYYLPLLRFFLFISTTMILCCELSWLITLQSPNSFNISIFTNS